jgi:hypothetical protein
MGNVHGHAMPACKGIHRALQLQYELLGLDWTAVARPPKWENWLHCGRACVSKSDANWMQEDTIVETRYPSLLRVPRQYPSQDRQPEDGWSR